jgi:endonuclease/exonuclease/phosphatase family metal-dependent hydrolase
VWALQEFPIEQWERMYRVLKRMFPSVIHMQMPREPFMLVIVSMFPLTDIGRYYFNGGVHGVLSSTVCGIRISNTHLVGGDAMDQRLKQIDKLKVSSHHPHVVLGDFNSSSESMEALAMKDNGWNDAWLSTEHTRNKCGYTQNSVTNARQQGLDPGCVYQRRTDRIYFSGSKLQPKDMKLADSETVTLENNKEGGMYKTHVSNHFPVVCTFQTIK